MTLMNDLLDEDVQPEPVAMRYDFDGYGWLYIDNGSGSNWKEKIKNAEPLYTAPPQSEWVGLTDEEKHQLNDALNLQRRFPIIDAIEARLREKNGG